MYTISIEARFSAAHQLVGYKGHCGRMHGHTWKIRVEVKTYQIDEIGISIDFKELRSLTESVLASLDHQTINEIPPFDKMNPTAENLSRHIYKEIEKDLKPPIRMVSVTVWESENHAVTYTEDA